MALLDDLIGGASPDDDDRNMSAGGLVPPGKYHARLDGSREVEANSGSVGRELSFTILAGPFKGSVVEDSIWKTSNEKTHTRFRIFAHRLGLLSKAVVNGKSQYTPVPGKFDFNDALGTECILEVKIEEEEWDDRKTGQKRRKMKSKFEWEGVFKLDDPKVKDVERATASGTAPPPPPKAPRNDDFGGLV